MQRLRVYLDSYQFRLLLAAVLFLIPAIFLPTLLTARIHTQTLMQIDERQALVNFQGAESNLVSLLSQASNAVSVVQTHKDVDAYLFGEFPTNISKVNARRDFIEALETAFRLYDYVTDILFIKEDGSIAGSSLDWHYSIESQNHPFIQTQAYQDGLDSMTMHWIGGYPRSYLTQDVASLVGGTEAVMCICGIRRLQYTYAGSSVRRNIAVLIAIDEAEIRSCFAFLADEQSQVWLLDSQGLYLSGKDSARLGMEADFFAQIPEAQAGSFSYTDAQGNPYRIVYARMAYPRWIMVQKIPAQVYGATAQSLWKNALLIGILSLMMICMLYAFWLRRMYKPFRNMTDALVAVRDGDLDTRLPEDATAPLEIRLMTSQMNRMLESLQDLILLNERSERRKYHLEMRSLQAQITPHFLFNTLTSIRWMATMSGADNVAEMLSAFVLLLRPVFGDWTMEWTLGEELHFVRNYVRLIQMRYGDRISILIEDDPSLHGHLVPRFTLQPILENSCEHAMPSGRPLVVRVCLRAQANVLVILVEDNGNGMSPETLHKLRQSLAQEEDPLKEKNGRHCIGLYNIHKRLSLYYGDAYGIALDSLPDQGTTVEIRMDSTRPGYTDL